MGQVHLSGSTNEELQLCSFNACFGLDILIVQLRKLWHESGSYKVPLEMSYGIQNLALSLRLSVV